ncbi:MAG TPA: GGDEF domain-containing protein [Pseudolabrys sp.]|nr:GGDEF domain-containing protein [Pseudolabrys sp.]
MAGGQAQRVRGDEADSLARLEAEVARLSAELARAQLRIAELEAAADVDPLVELLNRRGFERELGRLLAFIRRYGGEAALVFIDLDGFKAVNDAHGHGAGDALLKAVAASLARHVRAADAVGRLGGDEFGVLMWNIAAPAARSKAGELEGYVGATRVAYGDMVLTVGASAGLAMLSPQTTAAAAIEAADRAMYARKREKRG